LDELESVARTDELDDIAFRERSRLAESILSVVRGA
jgi:hypothetical protein